jgi:DNA polymerase-3 subunit gamma/tau
VGREPEQEAAEPEAQSRAVPVREEPDDRPETGIDLASEWVGIMGELKRRRQALTAAVYGEARVEGFDGKVLRLVYPEEQSFHVGMARDAGHLEKLGAVLEERLGSKPRLEVRAAGGEAAAPVADQPPPAPPLERRGPEPRPSFEEAPPETGSPNGSGGTVAESGGPESGAMGNDDKIRNEREVFEMAREFDLFDNN